MCSLHEYTLGQVEQCLYERQEQLKNQLFGPVCTEETIDKLRKLKQLRRSMETIKQFLKTL